MLTVRMLGELTFCANGARVREDLGRSGRMLAAYLFQFSGRIHRRERLVDLFWPELETDHARSALNTAVWRMRRLIMVEPESRGASNLVSDSAGVAIEPASWLKVDTLVFDASVRAALKAARSDGDQPVAALEEAAGVYTGAFLDGIESDWVVSERERLHSLYVQCMNQLVQFYAARGIYEEAISAARRILFVDPFRESVQRSLALLLVLNGQRVHAIHDLAQFKKHLRRDIGIDPMPETCALEAAIVSGQVFSQISRLSAAYFSDRLFLTAA